MKAQMAIEFVVAAVIFFSLILYVLTFMNSSISEYRDEFYVNDLQSRVIQISELLVHDSVVGISGGYPVVSSSRINSLQQRCDDSYPNLLVDLDLRHHRIKIQVNESDTGNAILDCPGVISRPETATKVSIMRFGVLDTTNEAVILNLWVW
jgi:hypothetical protein